MISDPLSAAEIVTDRFGWARPLAMTPAGEGHMGRIWRLATSDGSYAVKELHWARDIDAEEAAVARQAAFCDAARAAGVAAPENLRTTEGRYMAALPTEHGGGLIRAYEWIDGQPLRGSDPRPAAWAGEVAAIIEGIAAPAGDQMPDPWSTLAPSADDWAVVVERCEAAGAPWADELRRAVPGFVALADKIEPPRHDELIIAHTDFQPQNVLREPDGRLVLLDWDDAGPAAPRRVLGQLVNNWHIHHTDVDHDGPRQTFRGYRDTGGTAAITHVTDLGDSICGYLNHVVSQADLALDVTRPAGLTGAARQRMPGLLQHPPIATYREAVRAAAAL
ncbi:phosphotransferase [Brachybacterium sp. YJGR34]|uniref:phosphotransferase n=1 Tax=Brachybacterium sp. YJGR34 TaxID=2059911 RepID=UPI000E0B975C|nr:phosphotransferase [Brachybacterium sp. YJGR34]